ncbi:MAG: hypothetical protein IKS49_01425, partial [Actinomycetaceae bacterium]|nr:hypothetical protein [Actinomycetaceae bacterium]
MKKTMTALLALALVVPLMFTLSGCMGSYSKSDVKRYVCHELGIKKFDVADEPAVKKNVRGRDGKYWTVTTDWYGLDQPLTFEVEAFCMADVIPRCGLQGSPEDAIDEAIARMYHPSGKLNAHYAENDDGTFSGAWYYPVSSRADFENSWSEIKKFQKFLQDYPHLSDHPFEIAYELESTDPLMQHVDSKLYPYRIEVTSGSTHQDFLNTLYSPQLSPSNLGAVDEYLKDAIELGIRSRIEEFSTEETAKIAKETSFNLVPVCDAVGKVIDPTVFYYKDVIVYGHLFQLARTAGLKVDGTWAEFVIHGADGKEYAFTYAHDEGDKYHPRSVTRVEAEQILGFPLDDSQDSNDLTLSAKTLAYVDVTPQEFIEQVEAHADGRKVSTEILDGGAVHVHAEKGVLGSVAQAYEEEVGNLEEQVRQASGSHFCVYVSHTELDKFDVRLDLTSKRDVEGENAERVKRIVQLLYLHRQLYDPGETPFVVSVAKGNGDKKPTELAVIT